MRYPTVGPMCGTARALMETSPTVKSAFITSWNRYFPGRMSRPTGNVGGFTTERIASCSETPSSCTGPYTSTSVDASKIGGKNGMPCTWSQCRWVSSAVPTNGRPVSFHCSPK